MSIARGKESDMKQAREIKRRDKQTRVNKAAGACSINKQINRAERGRGREGRGGGTQRGTPLQ